MNTRLLIQILVAMVLAIIVGLVSGTTYTLLGVPVYQLLELGGRLFLNALKLVVIPLIASSIITGAAKIGGQSMGVLEPRLLGSFY